MFGGGGESYLCGMHLCVASTLRSMRQVWQYASFGVCMDVSVYVLAVVVIVREVVVIVREGRDVSLCFALA